jgi:hypothetical protein
MEGAKHPFSLCEKRHFTPVRFDDNNGGGGEIGTEAFTVMSNNRGGGGGDYSQQR